MRTIRGRDAALREVRQRAAHAFGDDVGQAVRRIVDDVRARGDAAVLDATERFDGVRPATLVVPDDVRAAGAARVDDALRASMERAAARIEAYYARQPTGGFVASDPAGDATLGQLIVPVDAAGVYVPGGTAPLFSSLLMSAVPARVAGVERIVVATPPRADGTVPDEILLAAALVGVDTVVAAGGAQAIAALAYGTETLDGVAVVTGPGNDYVVAAKRQVFGAAGIEALPGPTETLVLAGPDADPHHVAADLLAQAEHLGAQPVLVTWSEALLDATLEAAEAALADLTTEAAARESMERRGLAVWVEDADAAMDVANAYAPEHLCLLVDDPWRWLPKVRNAGGVFLGAYSMEALGDYVAGPSHVMPTGGTARYASFLNLRHFQKVVPLVSASPAFVARVGPDAVRLARAEGLEAHARAVEARLHEDAADDGTDA
ncbi:MAG: histidinol dehydrogenase [Trueperaceae bacterium]|nr:histidinol dehydrogenase [Trueperaceae bacterium]